MAPSIVSLGTAALAFAGNAAAAKWYLEDTYDSTNFFDKFNFFTENSPNSGYVNFLSRADATSKGLAKVDNGEVIVKVDNTNVVTSGRGRNSVRLESKAQLNKGLIIGRFSHLPAAQCGSWPAFWTVGNNWPFDGEVDMLEGWNKNTVNRPAFHMGDQAKYGSCTIQQADETAQVDTTDCDNWTNRPPLQYSNQGCVSNDASGVWANSQGGVYAMEWTSDYINVFSWQWKDVPKNVDTDSPDTSTWGKPTMALKKSNCDINNIFKDQRIILNIDLCGNPVEKEGTWDSCAAQLKGATCRDFVAKTPSAFDNVFFKVKDIRIFNQNAPKTTTTSKTTSTTKTTLTTSSSTTKTSSSTASSTTKTSSSTASSTTKTSSSTASGTTKVTSTASSTKTTGTTTSTTSKNGSNKTTTITSKAGNSTMTTSSTTKAPVTTKSLTKTIVDTTSSPVTRLTTTKWSNQTTSSVEMTTSTVYTTAIHTITSCKPTITNCPIGKVTTVTIPLYTTVCPVSAAKTPAGPKPTKTPGHGGNGSDKTTITTKVTKTYTITSCAPTVTNCPVGKVTTEVITTTYCPGEQTQVPVPTGPKNGFTTQIPFRPSKTVIQNTETRVPGVPVVPKPSNGNNDGSNGTSIVQPRPTGSAVVCVGESCGVETSKPTSTPAPGKEGCTGPNCPPTVVSGAGKQSLSALVVLGAVAAMML